MSTAAYLRGAPPPSGAGPSACDRARREQIGHGLGVRARQRLEEQLVETSM